MLGNWVFGVGFGVWRCFLVVQGSRIEGQYRSVQATLKQEQVERRPFLPLLLSSLSDTQVYEPYIRNGAQLCPTHSTHTGRVLCPALFPCVLDTLPRVSSTLHGVSDTVLRVMDQERPAPADREGHLET